MNPSNRRTREPLLAASSPEVVIPAPPRPSSRWLSHVRMALGVLLVAGASTAVAWVARHHVMTSPRFAVADIDVDGVERRPEAMVAAESGIEVGQNVFALDLDAARERLLADPWIAQATLARRLPGTILIQVVERKAAAMVALGETFLATSEGEPFKRLEANDPTDLPLITGLRPEELSDDRDGTMRTIRRGIDLAAEYERSPLAKRAPLEEVHVGTDGEFTVVVGRSATQLVLGGPPFRRKLDQAARVLAELDKRGAKADSIMLDNDGRPERVVVRMR